MHWSWTQSYCNRLLQPLSQRGKKVSQDAVCRSFSRSPNNRLLNQPGGCLLVKALWQLAWHLHPRLIIVLLQLALFQAIVCVSSVARIRPHHVLCATRISAAPIYTDALIVTPSVAAVVLTTIVPTVIGWIQILLPN